MINPKLMMILKVTSLLEWHKKKTSIALNVSNMTDWLLIILDPHNMLGIPQFDIHLFQIFVAVACDYIRFVRNKAHHDGLIPNAIVIFTAINKTVLEHYFAWRSKQVIIKEVWKHPSPYFKINHDTTIWDSFSA
jgi:hypothetical protein